MNLLFLSNVFECESIVLLLEDRYDDEAAERLFHYLQLLEAPIREGMATPSPRA